MSLKKFEIIAIRGSLMDSVKASKSATEQEILGLIVGKFDRYIGMARGERKTVAKRAKKAKKK